MPTSNCKNCQTDFAYDFDLGLNVKFYEYEATPRYFRASGESPCCPNCEARCDAERKTFGFSDIKFETRIVQKKSEIIGLLPEKPEST